MILGDYAGHAEAAVDAALRFGFDHEEGGFGFEDWDFVEEFLGVGGGAAAAVGRAAGDSEVPVFAL